MPAARMQGSGALEAAEGVLGEIETARVTIQVLLGCFLMSIIPAPTRARRKAPPTATLRGERGFSEAGTAAETTGLRRLLMVRSDRRPCRQVLRP